MFTWTNKSDVVHAGKIERAQPAPEHTSTAAAMAPRGGTALPSPDHTRTLLHNSDSSTPQEIPSDELPSHEEVRAVLTKHLRPPSPVDVSKVGAVELDAQQSLQFLDTKVKATNIVIVKTRPAGILVARSRGLTMTRRGVLKSVVIWFAKCVLGKKLTGKTKDEQTVEALDAMQELSKEEAREKHLAYIFKDTDEENRDGGVYASDAQGDEMMASVMQKVLQSDEGGTMDLLELLPNTYDGVSKSSPWLYTGITFAGHHIEDSYQHFNHDHVRLKFNLTLLSDLDIRLLEWMEKFSFRDWFFCLKSNTPEHVQWLCKEIETAFDVPHNYFDRVLHERSYVLNPKWWMDKHPHQFQLVHQGRGDRIVTNQSHSVVGLGILSVAYNIAKLDYVRHYVACECLAAVEASKAYMWHRITNIEKHEKEGIEGLRGYFINFTLTVELMRFLMEELMPSPEVDSALLACADMVYKCNDALGEFRAAVRDTRAMTPHEQNIACTKRKDLEEAPMLCAVCGMPLPFYAVNAEIKIKIEYDVFLCGGCALKYTWADDDRTWMPTVFSEHSLYRLGIGPRRSSALWQQLGGDVS